MYEYKSIISQEKYYSSLEYSEMSNIYDSFGVPIFYSYDSLRNTVSQSEFEKALKRFGNEILKLNLESIIDIETKK